MMIRRFAGLAAAVLLLASCADHASALRSRIDAATSELDRAEGDASKEVTYAATTGHKPYTIIFFPERRVFETELIARGVDAGVAKRIFHDLSRFGVGEKERPMVVVAEVGKPPSFASYSGRQLVHIDDLLIANKADGGDATLTMQKRGETYYITSVR
jgi:hypothetical protein